MTASENADDANMTQAMRTYHEFHELAFISLYEPIVSHILSSVNMLGHLIALFESYYSDLVAYDHAYVAAYRATLKDLVSALMLLREVNADKYYEVIHEFSMQEYYGILGGLEKATRLTRFRTALDAAVVNGNMVDVAAAYTSYLYLGVKPTHLTDLLEDLKRVQRLVTVAESAKKN